MPKVMKVVIKYLKEKLIDLEKQKDNLLDSLKYCEVDTVKKTIVEEITKTEIS